MIAVTTNEVPGHRITAVFGEVMGLTVRSANFGQSFTAGFRAIGGGEIPEYTRVMYDSRFEVMNRMMAEAERRGANAVVAMRFDTDAIGNFSEVCAYGTAVTIEPVTKDVHAVDQQQPSHQGAPQGAGEQGRYAPQPGGQQRDHFAPPTQQQGGQQPPQQGYNPQY